MDITTHKPGSFCTCVLRTQNLDRAASFYNSLVGWNTQGVPGTSRHRLLQFGGKTVANLHQIAAGSDLWVPHVSVEKIELPIATAVGLGAALLDTVEIPGLARLATLRDPEGAVFGMWEPAPHQGAQLMEGVGSIWWIEVLVNDVPGTREFYGRLFGWTSVETSFEPFEAYTFFKRGDAQEGGILPIGRDWGVSPRWNSIFAVEDCDAAIEHAQRLGGSKVFVHTVPKAGRIGLIDDSGGALFVMRGPVHL
jgi:uncharacterized protein